VLSTLGDYYYLLQDYERAINYYNRSLKVGDSADTLVNLGAAYWSRHQKSERLVRGFQGIVYPKLIERLKAQSTSDRQEALTIWQKAIKLDSNAPKAIIYLAKVDSKYLPQAKTIINRLPDRAAKVPFLLNLAELSGKKELLQSALNLTEDPRIKSWIYYQQETIPSLIEAIKLAESIPAYDLLWRYQWKLANLYGEVGDLTKKHRFLELAVGATQELNISPSDVNLKTTIEPLYKDLAQVYLEDSSIRKGQEILNLLQISQLQSFLLENCFEEEIEKLEVKSNNVAYIQTLVVNRGVFIIVRKGDRFSSHFTPIKSEEIQQKVLALRTALQDTTTEKYIVPAQELYNLLIAPIKPKLNGVKQIVFNHDPILSTIPYSTLYDGQKFLIEDFAIAYSLGLAPAIRKNQNPVKTLLVGIDNPPHPWSQLPYAEAEIDAIAKTVPTSVKAQEKTFSNFKTVQQGFSTIHIATHSQLAVDVKQSTIVFGDREVTMAEFQGVLASRTEPIDLLVLSGCQTGVGDSLSILGLAGIAAKNNVDRVLASLWGINDADTATLMELFYGFRHPSVSEAQALQMAQIRMLQNNLPPSSWSSFILIER
jgi:CHAT domain-containing protein